MLETGRSHRGPKRSFGINPPFRDGSHRGPERSLGINPPFREGSHRGPERSLGINPPFPGRVTPRTRKGPEINPK